MSYNLNSVIGQNYAETSLYKTMLRNLTNTAKGATEKNGTSLLDAFKNAASDTLTIQDVLQLEADYGVDVDGNGIVRNVLGVSQNNPEDQVIRDQRVQDVSNADVSKIGKAFQDAGIDSFSITELQQLASDGTITDKDGNKVNRPDLQRAATAMLNQPVLLQQLDLTSDSGAEGQYVDTANLTNYPNGGVTLREAKPVVNSEGQITSSASAENGAQDTGAAIVPPDGEGGTKPAGEAGAAADSTSTKATANDITTVASVIEGEQFSKFQLEALARGEFVRADGTKVENANVDPEVQKAAQNLLNDPYALQAMDMYGSAGSMDGANDSSYWTTNFNSPGKILATANSLRDKGTLENNGNGTDPTVGGTSVDVALKRENQQEADLRNQRQQDLETIAGIPQFSNIRNGKQGFTLDELNNIDKSTLTKEQQDAVNRVLGDSNLMLVMDLLDTTGLGESEDGWVNADTLKSNAIYAARYAAQKDAGN